MLSKGIFKRVQLSLRDTKHESATSRSTIELLEPESGVNDPWFKQNKSSLRRHSALGLNHPLTIRRQSCPNLGTGLNYNDAGGDSHRLEEIPETGSHVNENFDAEEAPPGEFFVAAFGSQGKKVGELQDAKDILVMENNRILTSDLVNNRLQMFTSEGQPAGVISGDEIQEPWGVAINEEENIVVTLSRKHCVAIFDEDGNLHQTYGESIFKRPAGIAITRQGWFVVCDSGSRKVSVHDKDFKFIRELVNPAKRQETFNSPRYVCVNSADDIIVSDSGDHCIKMFNSDGEFLKSFGGFGSDAKYFKCPYGICTDRFDNIFIADHYNNRISVYTRHGNFVRHIVTSEHGLIHPQGLVIRGNYLYVTHGHLKANEILIFKFNNAAQCIVNTCTTEYITHI